MWKVHYFGGFHRTLQRVRLANRVRLLLQTPGPVPFGTCICSNVETILSWTCHVYGPFESRTSLGTSILLWNALKFALKLLCLIWSCYIQMPKTSWFCMRKSFLKWHHPHESLCCSRHLQITKNDVEIKLFFSCNDENVSRYYNVFSRNYDFFFS